MNVFLDTSAVIKLYHQEVGSNELLAFLNAHTLDLILTISETSRALSFIRPFFDVCA